MAQPLPLHDCKSLEAVAAITAVRMFGAASKDHRFTGDPCLVGLSADSSGDQAGPTRASVRVGVVAGAVFAEGLDV
jgi:hypothetical protein